MNKKECDIIKDLLPSYVDNICSEASREWIEAHLAECEECRASAEVMKNTEFSAQRLEQEQLEAGRKIIRQNLRRSVLNLGLCFLMAFLMFFVFRRSGVQIPHMALYIVFPICMMMTWLVCRNQSKVRSWDKWDTILLSVAVIIIGYGAVMMRYGFTQVTKETLFGLTLNEFGAFLYGQMVLAAVACFVIYLIQMVRTIKAGRSNSLIMSICLTGIFLMMSYCIHMGYLADLDVATEQLKKATMTVLLVGLNITMVFALIDKLVKR